jgi:hypothetical protein
MSKQNMITPQDIMEMVVDTQYVKLGEKTTVCCLILENGFEIVGTSFCIDPKDFNELMGQEMAFGKAIDEARRLEAYFITCLNAEIDAMEDKIAGGCDCGCECMDEQEHDCDCDCEDCEDMNGDPWLEEYDGDDLFDCGCDENCDCDEHDDCDGDEISQTGDIEDCLCYGCSNPCEDSECKNGCPNVDCDQNEEHDFQGYEDDGTEDYSEDTAEQAQEEVTLESIVAKKQAQTLSRLKMLHDNYTPEQISEMKEMALDKLIFVFASINPVMSFEQLKALAKSIIG